MILLVEITIKKRYNAPSISYYALNCKIFYGGFARNSKIFLWGFAQNSKILIKWKVEGGKRKVKPKKTKSKARSLDCARDDMRRKISQLKTTALFYNARPYHTVVFFAVFTQLPYFCATVICNVTNGIIILILYIDVY